jgi:hypothetical protein
MGSRDRPPHRSRDQRRMHRSRSLRIAHVARLPRDRPPADRARPLSSSLSTRSKRASHSTSPRSSRMRSRGPAGCADRDRFGPRTSFHFTRSRRAQIAHQILLRRIRRGAKTRRPGTLARSGALDSRMSFCFSDPRATRMCKQSWFSRLRSRTRWSFGCNSDLSAARIREALERASGDLRRDRRPPRRRGGPRGGDRRGLRTCRRERHGDRTSSSDPPTRTRSRSDEPKEHARRARTADRRSNSDCDPVDPRSSRKQLWMSDPSAGRSRRAKRRA